MVTLSPDGKYIGYLAPKNGILNIWLIASSDLSKAKPVTNNKSRRIKNYHWAYNSEHILYTQDYNGDENFCIYSLNLKTNHIIPITPEKGVRASIYGMSEKKPNEILIGMNNRNKRYFDIYEVNLKNNSKKLILKNNKFSGFIIDSNLTLRFATFINNDGDEEYFQFKENKWYSFMRVSLEDSISTTITGLDETGTISYLLDSRNRNTAVLKSLNLNSGKSKILAEDEKSDVKILTRHPIKKTIQAVTINYEKPNYKVLDNSIKSDFEYLKSINSGEITINSRTLDDQNWLIAYQNDTNPIKYYKYYRKKKKVEFLFSNKKDLEKYKLSEMNSVVIKARDGLNLVSYITLPVENIIKGNIIPLSPLPLVLCVHGGPWTRDTWGLNIIHQWLANRGYAVLSVNFRGSTGFGKDFVNAANMQWGCKMQDDLIDAVNWAVSNKIATPEKIAIMGGSYGGYATLASLTFTPDIFACGIDIVGPSNLYTFIKSIASYWKPTLNNLKRRIGSWDNDQGIEVLNKISPLTFVHRIKKPLFIVHGAYDPNVKQTESDQMVQALNGKNIPVIYALYYDEGHGLVRPENKISCYSLIEQFLAKTLGGRVEPIGKDLKGANFLLNGKRVNYKEAEQIINKSIN